MSSSHDQNSLVRPRWKIRREECESLFETSHGDLRIFVPRFVRKYFSKMELALPMPRKFIDPEDINEILAVIFTLAASTSRQKNQKNIFKQSIFSSMANARTNLKIHDDLKKANFIAFFGNDKFYGLFDDDSNRYVAFKDLKKRKPILCIYCKKFPVPLEFEENEKILFIEKKNGFIKYYWIIPQINDIQKISQRKCRASEKAFARSPSPIQDEPLPSETADADVVSEDDAEIEAAIAPPRSTPSSSSSNLTGFSNLDYAIRLVRRPTINYFLENYSSSKFEKNNGNSSREQSPPVITLNSDSSRSSTPTSQNGNDPELYDVSDSEGSPNSSPEYLSSLDEGDAASPIMNNYFSSNRALNSHLFSDESSEEQLLEEADDDMAG